MSPPLCRIKKAEKAIGVKIANLCCFFGLKWPWSDPWWLPKVSKKAIFLEPSTKILLTFEGMDLYLISRPLRRKLPVGQILALHAPTEVFGVKGARFFNTYQRLHQFWTNRPRAWIFGKWDIYNGTELILSFCLNFWESESCLLFPPDLLSSVQFW